MMTNIEHAIYFPMGGEWERIEMSDFNWQTLILNHGWAGADPDGEWLGAMVTHADGTPEDANWRPLDELIEEIRSQKFFVLNGESHAAWRFEV